MAESTSGTSTAIGLVEVDIEVHQKYDIKRRIGKGAYGIVWQAVNKQTGQVVAVKKIFDAFRNRTDAQRTYREVMFLQRFGHHPNITTLLEVMRARNDLDLYLVLEHMDSDLHQVIKRGNLLKDVHVRYIMYQLLLAMQYLHSANVIHRDQKPSNILLDSDCRVKVADFGLARSLSQVDEDDPSDPTLTEYVATRWYRAPEILLAEKSYTTGVDMWSVGCILGEMILGKPLFPGSSTLNQIERIMAAIRPPTWAEIMSMCSGYALAILERANNRPKRPLRDMVSMASDDALDLLTKLLVLCPDKRMSAKQALRHPYVSRFQRPAQLESAILECPRRKLQFTLRDEPRRLSVAEYRQKLYQLIESNENELDEPTDREDLMAESFSDDATDVNRINELEANEAQCQVGMTERTTQYRPMDSELGGFTHLSTLIMDSSKQGLNDNENMPQSTRKSTLPNSSNEESPIEPMEEEEEEEKVEESHSMTTATSSAGNSTNCSAVAAGLPSHHPRANTASAWLRFHHLRSFSPVVYKPIAHQTQKRPITSSDVESRVKPNYGRKQFGNFGNSSSLGSPKMLMHSFTQSHGTIAASALKQLRLSK